MLFLLWLSKISLIFKLQKWCDGWRCWSAASGSWHHKPWTIPGLLGLLPPLSSPTILIWIQIWRTNIIALFQDVALAHPQPTGGLWDGNLGCEVVTRSTTEQLHLRGRELNRNREAKKWCADEKSYRNQGLLKWWGEKQEILLHLINHCSWELERSQALHLSCCWKSC